MTKTYVRPDISICGLDLEGFLCVSGEPICDVNPLCADVTPYEDAGVAEVDKGDFIF